MPLEKQHEIDRCHNFCVHYYATCVSLNSFYATLNHDRYICKHYTVVIRSVYSSSQCAVTRFRPGRTLLGEFMTLPRSHSRMGRGHPIPVPCRRLWRNDLDTFGASFPYFPIERPLIVTFEYLYKFLRIAYVFFRNKLNDKRRLMLVMLT